MAVLAPLIAFIGRQLGRLVQMVFGWATLMLFGRVPQSKQLLLAGVSAGALLWLVVLVGVAVPDFGAWLIAFVPAPDFVDEGWIRLGMLVLALALPLAIGAGGLMLMDPADRPEGIGGQGRPGPARLPVRRRPGVRDPLPARRRAELQGADDRQALGGRPHPDHRQAGWVRAGRRRARAGDRLRRA